MRIETVRNKPVDDTANAAAEYIMGMNGIVPEYGSEMKITYSGKTITIGPGLLIADGRKIYNDENSSISIQQESVGTKQYKLYLLAKMADPDNCQLVVKENTFIAPEVNLFSEFLNAEKYIHLATIVNGTAGVMQVTPVYEILGRYKKPSLFSANNFGIEGMFWGAPLQTIVAANVPFKWELNTNLSKDITYQSSGVFNLKGGRIYMIDVNCVFSGGDFAYYGIFSGTTGVSDTQSIDHGVYGLGVTYPAGSNRFSDGGITTVYDLTDKEYNSNNYIRVATLSASSSVTLRSISNIRIISLVKYK